MNAVDSLGSATRSFVGHQPISLITAGGSPAGGSATGSAESSRRGGPSPDGRDLLISVLLALAALMAAVVLAPIGGRVVLGIGLLAAALLAFAIRRWVRLQRRIQSVAREWQLTIDAVESPILTLDLDGRILRMNRAAMLLSGKPYSQNLGQRISALGPGEPWRTAGERVDRARAGGGAQAVTMEDADTGESWEISTVCAPVARPVPRVRNPGPEGPTIVAVARNVTELVALHESLHRQELLSAMGSLVGGVAHDMRNFLFALNGTIELFETRFGDREDQRPYFRMLREHGGRINSLMQTLLDYGKPVEVAPEPQAVGEVIAEARQICAPEAAARGVELEILANGRVPRIPVDRTRILQVFKNLLENAVQHSPEGGRVLIDSEHRGEWIECRVRDSGPGLGDSDSGRLFEPFFSKRKGGTGLGLAIVHRVVTEHGGEVEAVDHPEGGAEFRVRLPAGTMRRDRGTSTQG